MALQSNFYWTISYMKSKILLKSRYFYNIHGSYGSCFTSSQTRSCHGYISCQPVGVSSFLDYKIGFRRGFKNCRKISKKHQIYAEMEFANALDVINDLGLDTMTFFAVTVTVVPVFKQAKASPILGFFFAGIILNQFGLIRNITDIKALSEWGILFLLFEMGLELSLARLKALAKFAFGMGLSQVILCTLAFTAFELPPNAAFGTKVLEFLFHSRPDLVNIRSVDEAVVIGAALSLSSSAFVLQLLADKGELPTRFGSATLGILLLQDIAVVPLLVILPILEGQNLGEGSMWPMLASESLKALGGLGLLSLGGKFLLRRIFEMVADSRSSEAFVALCLLTVTSTSLMTQKLGFSDTLGAFLAGALLAETNYRTQIEADIRPFRGLLLGLFFVTTGSSIDIELLLREWPNVLTLLGGLIAIKTLIIAVIGPRVGLSLQESLRIGFLLSQGGEFAFVVFSLANRLGVLPLELNRLLIIVVVLSMALTPLLNEVGRKAAGIIDSKFDASDKIEEPRNFNVSEPVVILGFSQMGQVLANFLSTPLVASLDGDLAGIPYVAFDLDPTVVKTARDMGFPVLYGDGSRLAVLQSAGISRPKAVMVMHMGKDRSVQAVERIRVAFPSVPIYARAEDLEHLLKLKKAGVTDVILENAETSLQLGAKLLRGLGVMSDDVSFLSNLMRESMEIQAEEALAQKDSSETEIMKPVQVKMSDSLALKMGERQEKGMGDLEYLKLQATKQTDSMEDQTESLDLNSSVRSQKSPSISDKLLHLTSNTDSNNDGKTEIIVQNGHDSTASEQKTFTMNISDQLLPVSSEDAEDSTTISDQKDVKLCNSSDDSVLPSEQGEGKGDIYLDQNTKCISPSD